VTIPEITVNKGLMKTQAEVVTWVFFTAAWPIKIKERNYYYYYF